MHHQEHPPLQEALERGYHFQFGQYLESGFNLFGKYAGPFIAFAFIYFSIIGILGLIPMIGGMAEIVVAPPLGVGCFLVADALRRDERPEFGLFFKGFDWIGPLIVQNLIQGLVFVIPAILLGAGVFMGLDMGIFNEPSMTMVAVAVIIALPAIYLGIAWSWAPLFIVFYGMDFWPAMETSRRLITRQWVIVFAFYLVLGLLLLFGVLMLGLGLLVAYPVAALSIYAAFADITKLHEESGDQLTRHLVL